jgi:hypothetical protein
VVKNSASALLAINFLRSVWVSDEGLEQLDYPLYNSGWDSIEAGELESQSGAIDNKGSVLRLIWLEFARRYQSMGDKEKALALFKILSGDYFLSLCSCLGSEDWEVS